MKSRYFFLFIALFPLLVKGGIVTPDKAERVALNFYTERVLLTEHSLHKELRASVAELIMDGARNPLYYHIDITPGGFVLVSGIDAVVPVLGYAFDGEFRKELRNLNAWMQHYTDQISFISESKLPAPAEILAEWNRLETDDPSTLSDLRGLTSVAPLLVSKWNQDKYYNGQCPLDPAGPDGRCYAGCVATAMGQLLYYYRFPMQGQGSYSYIHPVYGNISADFGATTYDWNGMPGSLSSSNFPVANLLFHQGVSVDMDYGPDGSGMWNHKAAYSLKTYFRYGPETQYYFRDSISLDWDSILIVNLDQRKPLYYAGWAGVQSNSGHAFVCDGYQGTDYFHFNWGWGGQSDGYFYLNNLTPGGSNFNFAQEVIPMFPDTLLNTYPVNCAGRIELNGVRGSIEDGSGWYPYLTNRSCSWLINPQDPEYDSVSKIKLTFLKMNTETGHDLITIYDGDTTTAPVLGVYSGNTLPPSITSSGNKMLLVFESDAAGNLDGWQADYESIFPVYCSGTTLLTDLTGDISDGSGNKNYINSSLCKWKINPAGAGSVTLVFTGFDLPDSLDVLRIFDQATSELLATYTGSQIPEPVTAFSGKMLLMFYTNKSVTGQGWEGYYTSSLVGMDETNKEKPELIISPNPALNHFKVEYFCPVPENARFTINSVSGSKVYDELRFLKKGKNTFQIDSGIWESGIYLLQMKSLTTMITRKIIVL